MIASHSDTHLLRVEYWSPCSRFKQQKNRPDDSKGIWFMKPWYPSPRIFFPYMIFLLLLDGGQFHCPSNRPSIWKSAECIYISDWPVAYHFHRICRRLGPFWCKIVWRRMVFVRTKAQNLSSVWLHRCLDEGTRAYKWPSVKSSNTLKELLSSSLGVSWTLGRVVE